MRIGDFAAAAGVSARTVRYYIVEGLLPPPEGAGLGAMYDQAHLDRLRLILRLKDAYLPLKEIRRQLTGLDDAGVRRRLKELETAATKARSRTTPADRAARSTPAIREDSAANYLQRIARTGGMPTPSPADAAPRFGLSTYSSAEPNTDNGRDPLAPGSSQVSDAPDDPVYPGYLPPGSPLTIGRAIPAAPPPEPPVQEDAPEETTATAENWVRLRIGDDAELLVRSGAYHRLRDRVDWLVGWARAIFR